MLPSSSLTEDSSGIMMTTARSRRMDRNEMRYKRRISRRLSHQLSVDNDILVAGDDLYDRVKEDDNLIKTSTYLDTSFESSFKGEALLHWMISHHWATNVTEAISISQLLLTHNVIANVSDTRNLMTFKKFALYRFRKDQDQLLLPPSSDLLDLSLERLYRRLWSEWVIRSRVVGWWLYTNTLTGEELISWMTSSEIVASKEEARHFANQLLLVNFLIQVYPTPSPKKVTELNNLSPDEYPSPTFQEDDTIYQINVCCNQTVDTSTKVFHTLAHAVRLCSSNSQDCIFYGKTKLPDETIVLQQFELEDDSPGASLQSEADSSADEDAKNFLQAVCRAYYPDFTTAIEETYYSYDIDPDGPEQDFCIPDEIFHSFHLSTYEDADSVVIEFEDGVDLTDLVSVGEMPAKSRACTLDLMPTPQDSSLLFKDSRLELKPLD